VTGLTPAAGAWLVRLAGGHIIEAHAVVVATGGLSVPQTGSDGGGLAILEALGHRISPPYAALTPLVAAPPVHAHLSGVSLPVTLRVAGTKATASGGFLFTHRGYSGPAVLDVSHVAVKSSEVKWVDSANSPPSSLAVLRVQWTDRDAETWTRDLRATTGLVVNLVGRYVPERLAEVLCLEAGLPPDRRGPELRKHERTALVEALTAYVLPWTGDEGYKKAEVTGGGVALTEVNPRTLESVRHPGLFLCGEMLDAFGPIGGHNFAWAWATGRAAGLGAAAS
jgi:predicted Rossmann fold flavoprotein